MQKIKKPLSSAKDQRLQNDSFDKNNNNNINKNIQLENWSIPANLIQDIQRADFPISSFPATMQDAINEVFCYVKAPIELISTCALTALSVCCQGLALVRRDSALIGPIGIYSLVIAESGERKTTCDSFFIKPLREYQLQSELDTKKEKDFYDTLTKKYEKSKKALLQKLEKQPEGSPEEEIKKELNELYDSKPVQPTAKKFIYADTTPEALAWSLYNNWKIAAIISAEAGEFFGSTAMRPESLKLSLSILNNLWDGSEVIVDRKVSESFVLRNACLTTGLQVQSSVLNNFLNKNGTLARGSGFLPRFFVVNPVSTQGYRTYEEAHDKWVALEIFRNRILTLLSNIKTDENNSIIFRNITLNKAAKDLWSNYHNSVEYKLRPNNYYCNLKYFASKSSDNVARLATLFELYKNETATEISEATMHSAIQVGQWYLDETNRFFNGVQIPKEIAMAKIVEEWLVDYCSTRDTNVIKKADIGQRVTNCARETYQRSLAILESKNRLKTFKNGKKIFVGLNPHIYDDY